MGRPKKYNKITIYKDNPEFARVEVISKKFGTIPVIIDAEDIPKVEGYTWCVNKHKNTFYAVTNIQLGNRKYKSLYLHRLIMDFPELHIDHVSGNGLDNRKSNLRICTCQENHMNRKSHKNSSSKYKGISWHKRDKIWQARIRFNGKLIYIGYFDSDIEAAKAYDAKALELFDGFAKLNFPLDKQ